MKTNISILMIILVMACSTPTSEKKKSSEDSIEISFSFDTSQTDFTVNDSLGNSLTFSSDKDKDSLAYHFLRFRTPDNDSTRLLNKLAQIDQMWTSAEKGIRLDLTSINPGYPLQYEDILRRQVKTFTEAPRWNNHVNKNGKNADYQLISRIMYDRKVYPLDSLLGKHGYKSTGLSIEKVGFVLPEKLKSLGLDPNLIIPVPYMVWINVAKTE